MEQNAGWQEQVLHRFGRRMRARRKTLGLTQVALAERLGYLDSVAISLYERGLREPQMMTLLRLAGALETTAAELLPELGAGLGGTSAAAVDQAVEASQEMKRAAHALDRFVEAASGSRKGQP